MSEWKREGDQSDKVCYRAFKSMKDNIEKWECLSDVLKFLEGLAILDKKEDWIFDHLFKTDWNEKEIKNMAIVYMSAAKTSLQRLLKMEGTKDSPIFSEFLIDFICDIGCAVQIDHSAPFYIDHFAPV